MSFHCKKLINNHKVKQYLMCHKYYGHVIELFLLGLFNNMKYCLFPLP